MNAHQIIATSITSLPANTLFDSTYIYETYYKDEVSEQNYFKIINRLIQSSVLSSFSKGIIYIPKQGKSGIIPLSPSAIKSLIYKTNNEGCDIGELLYYQLKLTHLKPINYTFYTYVLHESKKIFGHATFKRLNVDFDGITTLHIQFMDVLCNYDSIPNLNKSAFMSAVRTYAQSFDMSIFLKILDLLNYQKRHIAFLAQILDYFNVLHLLSEMLSTRSDYNIPKWQ